MFSAGPAKERISLDLNCGHQNGCNRLRATTSGDLHDHAHEQVKARLDGIEQDVFRVGGVAAVTLESEAFDDQSWIRGPGLGSEGQVEVPCSQQQSPIRNWYGYRNCYSNSTRITALVTARVAEPGAAVTRGKDELRPTVSRIITEIVTLSASAMSTVVTSVGDVKLKAVTMPSTVSVPVPLANQ